MSVNEPQQEPQPLQSSAFVPPTTGGPVFAAEPPSKWPMVIGIIAIVFAGLGILGGVCGMGGSFMPHRAGSVGAAGVTAVSLLMILFRVALAVVLLFIGIGLLKRRQWSRMLALGWAVIDAIATVIGFVVGVSMVKGQIAAMSAAGGPSPPPGAVEGALVGGMGCVLILGLALPVFFLIWFSREKIKREVASWT